jgi:hypothetical protein
MVETTTIWEDVEQRIVERGVRVEQRLALLARLQEADASGADIAAALDELSARHRAALDEAKQLLLREIRG